MAENNNIGFDSIGSMDNTDLFSMFDDEESAVDLEEEGKELPVVDEAADDEEDDLMGFFGEDDGAEESGITENITFGTFDSAEDEGSGSEDVADAFEIDMSMFATLNESEEDSVEEEDLFGTEDEVDVEAEVDTVDEDDDSIGAVSSGALREVGTPSEDFDIDDMYVDKGTSSFGGMLASKTNEDAFGFQRIAISNITVTSNRIRKVYALDKLVLSIQNEGLLVPITVAPTKTDGIYVLVDGVRRLLACAKAGLKTLPCVVNHNVSVPEICIVEALSNHNKGYTVQEMLDYIEYIKKEKGIASATMIEHLLNMDSGDYNKLMDLVEDDDPEILTPLFGGQMSIQQAFKKLEQKRKKLGKEEKDAARANKVYGNTEEYGIDRVQSSGETADDGAGLSDEDVSNIISSMGNLDDITEDGEDLRKEGDNIEGFKPHKQDPNERERLDPKLRKAVLARDENTCKICEQISGQEYTEVLDVHHVVEVYLGGNDDINNLITACTCCHKLVHLWGRGELHVRPFEEMDELEERKFKRIIKLGNVIRKGMVAKGMKREELRKVDKAGTIGRRLKGSSDQVAG